MILTNDGTNGYVFRFLSRRCLRPNFVFGKRYAANIRCMWYSVDSFSSWKGGTNFTIYVTFIPFYYSSNSWATCTTNCSNVVFSDLWNVIPSYVSYSNDGRSDVFRMSIRRHVPNGVNCNSSTPYNEGYCSTSNYVIPYFSVVIKINTVYACRVNWKNIVTKCVSTS